MSMENHIRKLIKDHRTLDEEIHHMEATGSFEDEDLVIKKKKRLQLKDEITRLQKDHPLKD